ncbi:SH3 domain-containing protein [Peptostreptococcus equinus]|uniref:SH3 domain-containing protein n=1 Tax=Peptostreptococcus equinus TaxID=3003601 RepID=A0ABY7JQV4_9FIRM|nr:SH3 domain-containing protein [Peptostreptococcus sp. CBA3647]WAW15744.1 SH3 domain-containing protein [Peptostreptococcus sp. CBA3647]
MNLKVLATSVAAVSLFAVPSQAANQAQVSYQYVNVRSTPSTKGYVKFGATKGTKLAILSYKNGWYQVSINGRKGWMTANAVSFKKITNTSTNSNGKQGNNSISKNTNVNVAPKNYGAYVNTGSLNFRTGPSTSKPSLGRLGYKQNVRVIGQVGGWTKISVNGRIGYVASQYLSNSKSPSSNNSNISKPKPTKPAPAQTSNNYMSVRAPRLNVRSNGSISSRVIGSLSQNQKIQVLGTSGAWTKISINGKIGYVASQYLSNVSNTTNSTSTNNTTSTTGYTKQSTSLNAFVDRQSMKLNTISDGRGWRKATKNEIKAYANPNSAQNRNSQYQFAKLNRYTADMSAYQVNRYLNNYINSNNVFYNKGQAFINAAKANNINLLYFVSHSMIETGYGYSNLAKGSYYNGKKVYNFYGIGAYDGNAYMGGKQTAYRNGWTSIDKGLNGSANWIARNYIHNPTYRQDTLYKMRWDNKHPYHQYASDIRWSKMIGDKMQGMTRYTNKAPKLSYEKPVYR